MDALISALAALVHGSNRRRPPQNAPSPTNTTIAILGLVVAILALIVALKVAG